MPAEAPRTPPPLARLDPATAGPVALLVALVVVFGALSPDVFLTSANFMSILNEAAIPIMIACGLTVVLIAGEFDLSIGATASFGGAVSAVLVTKTDVPMPVVLVAVTAIGVAIGTVNGFLITYFKAPALIATLGVASILDGFGQLVTNNKIIFNGFSGSFLDMGQWTIGQLQAPIIYVLVIAVVLWLGLRYTVTGRNLYAVGGNREASRMCGIHVDRSVMLAFVVSGTLCALAGALYTARLGSYTPTFGASFLLPAFAAAFLGSVTLRRGVFHVAGTVLGVLLIGTGTTGLLIIGGPTYSQQLFAGAVLILATCGTRLIPARRPRRLSALLRSGDRSGA